MNDFNAVSWDDDCQDDCRQILRLAVREDLDRAHDWTTVALVPIGAQGAARVVARQAGVACGMRAISLLLSETGVDLRCQFLVEDGAEIAADSTLAQLHGSARDLLTIERILLNVVGRMSGIATLTSNFVRQLIGTQARLYDTRKTTPGWRRMEKYSVRCGGGHNHRTGLFDAVLIKDNHLAQWRRLHPLATLADAVRQARQFIARQAADFPQLAQAIVEVEVDSLTQLADVIAATPEIVLLDNMDLEQLREAVEMRNHQAPQIELEASGGVHIDTVAAIARTGVDRISCGALTHSAKSLDVALDWD
ncbi:MAG: carboxylating nicotinate-nucleotide diphosphorylase [Planctomycetes bacterium]|nr:carboxylating nicotinate-nucleotide diphosphorylase [Planctomycetota bacterium]